MAEELRPTMPKLRAALFDVLGRMTRQPARLVFQLSALGALAIAVTSTNPATLPIAVQIFAAQLGVNTLSEMLSRVAYGKADDDEIRQTVRDVVAQSRIDEALTDAIFQQTLADLLKQQKHLAYAMRRGNENLANQLTQQYQQHAILNNALRQEMHSVQRKLDTLIIRLDQIDSHLHGNDPFRDYLMSAYVEIQAQMQKRIISAFISLDLEQQNNLVTPRERDFSQGFSAVKLSEPQSEPMPFESFHDAFQAYDGRVLLLGQPGAGKTFTLLNFTWQAVLDRLDDPNKPLPLFGIVATWNPEKKPALHDWLAQRHALDADLIQQEMKKGRVLLLLDGLDELRAIDEHTHKGSNFDASFDNSFDTDPRIRFLDALPANNKIVLTCRERDYLEVGKQARLEGTVTLKLLTETQIRTYLSEQLHLLNLIEEDKDLRELTQTPLLLSIFAFAYQDMTDAEREQLSQINIAGELRDKIFLHYIDQRYTHEAAKVGAALPLTLGELTYALKRVAMENAFSGFWHDEQGITHEILPNVIDREWIEIVEIVADTDTILLLAERLHLLVRMEGNFYRFSHLLLRDSLAFNWALEILEDAAESDRLDAVSALGQIGDIRAVEPLIATLLNDLSANIRLFSAAALVQIGDERAIEPLITGLLDQNVGVRRHVAFLLGKLSDPRTIEPLIKILQDPVVDVRSSAAIALGRIGDLRAVEPLINAMHDPNPIVRSCATDALENIGEPAVLSLVDALRDLDTDVANRAAAALEHIGTPEALAAVEAWREEQSRDQKS